MGSPKIEKKGCGCEYEFHDGEDNYSLTPCPMHKRPSCVFCGYVIQADSETVRSEKKHAAHYACLKDQRRVLADFAEVP